MRAGCLLRALGDAGRTGCAKRDRPAPGLDEERVGVPVVAPAELHNLLPSGESTGQRIALMHASVPELTIRIWSM